MQGQGGYFQQQQHSSQQHQQFPSSTSSSLNNQQQSKQNDKYKLRFIPSGDEYTTNLLNSLGKKLYLDLTLKVSFLLLSFTFLPCRLITNINYHTI